MDFQFTAREADGTEHEIQYSRSKIRIANRAGVFYAKGVGRLSVSLTRQSVNRLDGRGLLEIVDRPKIPITTGNPRALKVLWPEEK